MMPKPLLSYKDVAINGEDETAKLVKYIAEHRFDPKQRPTEDDHILFISQGEEEIPIGSRENIITITGKSKSRKTIAASAIATAMFRSGETFLNFRSTLPEEMPILHIDTEQGYKHYFHSVERMLAGHDAPSRFTSLHTRDADIPMRLQLIEYLCESLKPGVIIIDGLTDLVYDINDQAEATRIGEVFLKLSSKYKLLVIGVIHTTKTTGFMTGAIGTIFEKKSETVIKVELDEKDKMVSHITCQFSRNKPFDNFSIRADDNHQYSIENEANISKKGEIDPLTVPLSDLEILFLHSFGHNQSISVKDLQKSIRSHSKDDIKQLISERNALLFIDLFEKRCMIEPAGINLFRRGPGLPKSTNQLEIIPKIDDDMPF
jgi:hypothetical protein